MNRNLDGTELTTDQLRAMAATTEAGRKALSSAAAVHAEWMRELYEAIHTYSPVKDSDG